MNQAYFVFVIAQTNDELRTPDGQANIAWNALTLLTFGLMIGYPSTWGGLMDIRFFVSGFVMAVASLMAGFLVHATLLHPDYQMLPNVFRSDEEGMHYFQWMLLAHLMIGFALTWIYRQGVQAGRSVLNQGLRFGVSIVCLMTIPTYLIYFAVLKIPAGLAHKQMLYDVPVILLLGVLVAFLNKKK
jgi:hypothetical protein